MSSNGPFAHLLGNPRNVIVLDVVLTYDGLQVSVSQLIEQTNLEKLEIKSALELLCESNIIKKTPEGHYITTDSDKVKFLENFHTCCYDETSRYIMENSDIDL